MNNNLTYLLLFLILFSISCSPKIETKKEAPTVMDKYIIGYIFPQNKILKPDEIAIEKLTHINYAFANIKNGEIIEGFDYDAENFKILNGLKSKNPELKILISVGGWTWSGNFSDMALTKQSRQKFIQSSIKFIQRHQLDGIDLDWEYPGLPGLGNTHRKEDKKNFTLLLKEFRTSLDTLGNTNQKHYLLTIAAGAFEDYLNQTEIIKAQRYLDFVNIMTYDFTGAWNPKTGHHSNLYSSSFDPEGISCDKIVSMFMERGVLAEKIVLGVPFYGRGWQNVNPQQDGLFQEAQGWEDDFSYKNLDEKFINKAGFKRLWDESARMPYLKNEEARKVIVYDDPESLKEKCDYIKKNGLRGAMFWVYHADKNDELLNTLHENIRNGTPTHAEHPLSDVLDGFHLHSYYAGSISTAAEFVSCGCKKIALSSPFTDEELAVMIDIAKNESEKYGVPIYVENDFLTTRLFDTSLTDGKSVIFIAQNQKILDEYFDLKKFKQQAIEQGNLATVEDEIAWKFGRLLSYDDETIKRLLQR